MEKKIRIKNLSNKDKDRVIKMESSSDKKLQRELYPNNHNAVIKGDLKNNVKKTKPRVKKINTTLNGNIDLKNEKKYQKQEEDIAKKYIFLFVL